MRKRGFKRERKRERAVRERGRKVVDGVESESCLNLHEKGGRGGGGERAAWEEAKGRERREGHVARCGEMARGRARARGAAATRAGPRQTRSAAGACE